MSINTEMSINYAAIALIVDRSGSMQSVAEDTKGGIQQFITSQKKHEGKASFTLVQFDHEYEVLHNFSDLGEVDEDAFAKQYAPRGSTALLDAIGRTVIGMSQKIEELRTSERPTRTIIAVVTDGEENSSREYTTAKIKQLIEEKQTLGWDFVFLGADLNAITTAENYGFKANKSACYDPSNISGAIKSIEQQVSSARNGAGISFSKDDREQLQLPKG